MLNDLMKPGGDRNAARELAEILAGKRSFSMAQRAVIEEARANLQPVLESPAGQKYRSAKSATPP